MKERLTALKSVGLSFDGESAYFAVLTKIKGRPVLLKTIEVLQENREQNPLKDVVSDLVKEFGDPIIVSALPCRLVLIRPIEVKLTKEEDVDAVLLFQAEPSLPFPADEAVVDRVVIEKSTDSTHLTLLAARKEHIQQHLTQLEGIEPEVVSTEPAALVAFSAQYSQAEGLHYILHIGKQNALCVLANGNLLLGAKHLDVSIEAGEPFCQQVTQAILAMGKQSRSDEVKSILITGFGSGQEKDVQQLLGRLHLEKLSLKDRTPQELWEEQEILNYAIPIGLALPSLPFSLPAINFRQGEYVYPYRWKRVKKPLMAYFGFCFLLSLFIYLFGNASLVRKTETIKQQYYELLAAIHKTPEELERDFKKKSGGGKAKEEIGFFDSSILGLEEIELRVDFLENQIKVTPEGFPLHANLPRVSDFLSWLAQHPKVSFKDAKGNLKQLLVFESIAYTMIKRPDEGHKSEKYSVKVDLEFTTDTALNAREFHDALVETNEFVNPIEKVKWSYNRGRYRASFLLKDRTLYSPKPGVSTGGQSNV